MVGSKQRKRRFRPVRFILMSHVSISLMEKTTVRKFNPEKFNPNGSGIQGQLFGLPFTPETAQLVVVPVPWEVTVSYHAGASLGPAAILEASMQVDLFIKDIPE